MMNTSIGSIVILKDRNDFDMPGRIIAVARNRREILVKEMGFHQWEHTFTLRKDGTYRRIHARKGFGLRSHPSAS